MCDIVTFYGSVGRNYFEYFMFIVALTTRDVYISSYILLDLHRYRELIKKIGREIDEALAEASLLEELGEDMVDVDKARALYRQIDIDRGGECAANGTLALTRTRLTLRTHCTYHRSTCFATT